jgi:hypothetical protein
VAKTISQQTAIAEITMVRLAVSTPDSPPLSTTTSSGSTLVIAQSQTNNNNNNSSGSVNNSSYETVAPSTSSPVQASVSPSQMPPPSSITSQALPLSTQIPHHIPPPFHSAANGIHDNGHHHNGGTLYLGAAYANEFYPGAEAPHGTAYFIPPELCPAHHTQLCTAVHPEYGKRKINTHSLKMNKEFAAAKLKTCIIFLCLFRAH